MEPKFRALRKAAHLTAPAELREARPDEYAALGELTVEAYAALPGMPDPNDSESFAGYYESLRAVDDRATKPGVVILVAVDSNDELLGGVTFCEDMKSYGAPAGDTGGEAAGIRIEPGPLLERVLTNRRHLDELVASEEAHGEMLAELEQREAFGRAAEPWEVANVMVFLASDLSSYMTGETVSVSSQHP